MDAIITLAIYAVYFGLGAWYGYLWRGRRETKAKIALLRRARKAALDAIKLPL